MKYLIFNFLLGVGSVHAFSQSLPYREIPEYPQQYTAGTVAARMVDGLGFRFYWATEGLTEHDLNYRPSAEARTASETIDHIYDLTQIIVNATNKLPNISSESTITLSFREKRERILQDIKVASDRLKASEDLSEFILVFKNGERQSEYPFWHQLNGPIADALWHTGQLASFRRSSGNPINPKASMFNGKLRQ